MQELGILIALITLFLFLPLIRPFIKALWEINGLNWLPLLSLGIIIALFPAFGFRPECIPLLVYTIIVNLINIPALVSTLSRLENDDFLERGVIFTFIAVVLLLLTSGIALYFLPHTETVLTDRAELISLRDVERDRDYYIRLYSGGTERPAGGRAGPARPLMLVLPPVMGSVMMTDGLCEALAERGFTVISYSRRGLDAPAFGDRVYPAPVQDRAALLEAFALGTRSAGAASKGKALETARKEDIRFLLSAIEEGELHNRMPPADCLFITGYGAGGAALIGLSADPQFTAAHPLLRGIIPVESPILSALEGEAPSPGAGEEEHWIGALWHTLKNGITGLRESKTIRISGLPRPALPAFFLVSDRVQNSRDRDGRYATILRAFHGAKRPSILAAVPGAGPLDYSDSPEKYPCYRVLFPGIRQSIWKNGDFAGNSASLMTNFAALVLTAEGGAESARSLSRRLVPGGDLYLESGGTWNLPEKDYILGL
jgi:hypothetical protein